MVHQEAGPAVEPPDVEPAPDQTSSGPLEGLSGKERTKMRQHLHYMARKQALEEQKAAMSPGAAERFEANRKRLNREQVAASRESSKRIKARSAGE